LRNTGIDGRLAAAGAAFERTTTFRVAFAVLALATERGRACFDALTAGRLRADVRRALWARAGFFNFLAVFAAARLFGAVRLRVAAFRAAVRLRPAVFRRLAFLAPAFLTDTAGRRRVARAAFRLAIRGPFRGLLTLTVSR